MRISMKARREMVEAVAGRYQSSGKKEKGAILDEFVATSGYCRWQASYVLRWWGRKIWVDDKKVLVVGAPRKKKGPRVRAPVYDERAVAVLKKVWKVMDYICGKRLAPVLGEMTELLERAGEIRCASDTMEKLSKMSAATIDRLLRPERKKHELKGRSRTKPGTLLKHQIPIRTFAEWDDARPGFVEIDLVSHEGGCAAGDFCHTLDLTDVATTWTETAAVRNKSQERVFKALKNLKENLPFPLVGIDSDNGSEFINHNLDRYCRKENITFTRSRAARKNDNCFVEQKNWSVVRRAVGYARYDTDEQLELLNELYHHLRLYTNFFMPSMKLISKQRDGSRVKKRYDKAQTPFQRVMTSGYVTRDRKRKLKIQYESLNPAALKRSIEHLQNRLYKTRSRLERLPAEAKRLKALELGRRNGAWVEV
jgi:hypothetical protein